MIRKQDKTDSGDESRTPSGRFPRRERLVRPAGAEARGVRFDVLRTLEDGRRTLAAQRIRPSTRLVLVRALAESLRAEVEHAVVREPRGDAEREVLEEPEIERPVHIALEHRRGEKLKIFKFKRRREYRRRRGHRDELTRIRVTSISG